MCGDYMLKGDRLILREVAKKDLRTYLRYWSDEDLCKFDGGLKEIPTINDLYTYFDAIFRSKKKYLSIDNEKGVIVGYVTYISMEEDDKKYIIGITIDKKFWGRGYGTEAMMVVMEYLFNELDAESISLEVLLENERAGKCYRNCGFIAEKVKDEKIMIDGKYKDILVMKINKKEFSKIVAKT